MSQPAKVTAKSLISVNQNCRREQWGTISIKACSGTTETPRNKLNDFELGVLQFRSPSQAN